MSHSQCPSLALLEWGESAECRHRTTCDRNVRGLRRVFILIWWKVHWNVAERKDAQFNLGFGAVPAVLLKTLVDKEQHVLFKLAQLLSYLATLDKLPASCHAGRRRTISSEKSCLISLPFLLTYTDISAVKSIAIAKPALVPYIISLSFLDLLPYRLLSDSWSYR